jgi:hypothetical protein
MIPKSGNRFSEKIMRQQNRINLCSDASAGGSPPIAP